MELNELRKKIDAVDDKLSALFLERMAIVEEIAKEKRKGQIGTEQKAREEEILARIKTGCPQALAPYLEDLYALIFKLSKDLQNRL